MYITFSHPIYLLFLIGIPIILIIHFLTLNTGRRRALRFANFDAISKVQGIEFFSKNIVVSSLSVLTLILLVASAAGITLHREMDASSFSFVLAIDSSRSMEATDILPNRLEAAKNSARDFIDSAAVGTKIGIVSFSGNSVIEQDMTADKEESKAVLGDVQMSAIEGTDIYETVITSSNLLKAEDARAVILLSDGQINVGSIDNA
ncbi:MAG: VWA domain-containing protein, partial [Nanoarchaeota archaeon]|nr:VWA domain-containing protein [Nanoarchaeota archaeon]